MAHWNGNVGWKWSTKSNKFSTPEATRLNSNLTSDRNQVMVRLALKKENSNREQDTQEEQTTSARMNTVQQTQPDQGNDASTQATTMSQIAQAKLAENVKKNLDPDLDSVASKDGQVKKVISDVITDTDAISTTSSITMGTNLSTAGSKVFTEEDSEGNSQTQRSVLDSMSVASIGGEHIQSILNNTDSTATKREAVTQKFQEFIAKAIAMQQKALDAIELEENKHNKAAPSSNELEPDPKQQKSTTPLKQQTEKSQSPTNKRNNNNTIGDNNTNNTKQKQPAGSENSSNLV